VRALLVLVLLLPAASTPAGYAEDGWEPLADGIGYREFLLPGPNRAYVSRMDRSNPNLIIDSGIALGQIGAGKETVSQMAPRYDQAINTWGGTWGSRNRVIVAINGSFYNTSTGVPHSGIVHSGVYTKWYGNLGGSSGFAWTLDRQAFIGQCIYHRPEKQVLTYLASGATQPINGVDVRGGRDDLILLTPDSGLSGTTRPGSLNAVVELERPLLILPLPAMVRGTIRELREDVVPSRVGFDAVILSAAGAARAALEASARPGDRLGISLEITDLGPDCDTRQSRDWTKTYAGVGGSFDFLLDGELQDFTDAGATTRHPRTAVCFNDDWIYFVVVDGRDPGRSLGMTIDELGRFCRDSLGARWGINQDGGGSSTMWVEGQVRNVPSDGTERQVANGLMMIVVEPPDLSTRFSASQPVVVSRDTVLRFGPGDNYDVAAQLPAGIVGEIAHHSDTTDGVLARGDHWWKVAFSQSEGWVREADLRRLVGEPDWLWPDIWPPAR
jgi:Phosphodiester glycosidase